MNPLQLSIRQIFLIDSIGAMVSAFSLGVVLVYFQKYIGMPMRVLYLLAAIASCFAIYSMLCHLRLQKNQAAFLKGIATANFTYCLLSVGLVTYYFDQLSWLGILYFVAEKIIVLVLAWIEWTKANAQQNASAAN
ncbi:MAG: hypothetical protein AAFO94_22740 [Bacteroidota bacterium]